VPERYLGKTLGKYRIEELIGSGGFAWVYRGYDPTLEIPVALKVLKPQFAGDPTFEERFRREASTAARLRHPNIVKIYAVGRDGDAVYFAMDFLPTGLASKLEASPTLPDEFVIRVGIDVARALGFAHREGVIHRDIKVDNILFDVHGNAVVADFGIARAVSGYTQQTGTNMVVGTPQYFAPEQARAKPLDGRADIYSLGVSLYRAATGRLPFEGDDWYEIARAHVEDTPPRPRSINPNISPAFEHVLLRCLAKHVDDRPATGEQLADELAEVLANPATRGSGSVTYLSPSDTPTLMAGAAARVRLERRLLARKVAPVLIALIAVVAVTIPLVARRSAARAAPVSLPATIVATPQLPIEVDSADTVRLINSTDTLAQEIARRQAARFRPPPTLGRLAVTASEGARVSLDGNAVGGPNWSSDSLKPGIYLVRAVVPSLEPCPTATAEQNVRIRAGVAEKLTLSPRPCGTLEIKARNAATGARFTLSADGVVLRSGALPQASPIILPVGQYEFNAQRPSCRDFRSTIAITHVGKTPLTFIFDCEAASPPGAP
jgi:serine/threonine-protein kinase